MTIKSINYGVDIISFKFYCIYKVKKKKTNMKYDDDANSWNWY